MSRKIAIEQEEYIPDDLELLFQETRVSNIILISKKVVIKSEPVKRELQIGDVVRAISAKNIRIGTYTFSDEHLIYGQNLKITNIILETGLHLAICDMLEPINGFIHFIWPTTFLERIT